jgi:hypothetical protein
MLSRRSTSASVTQPSVNVCRDQTRVLDVDQWGTLLDHERECRVHSRASARSVATAAASLGTRSPPIPTIFRSRPRREGHRDLSAGLGCGKSSELLAPGRVTASRLEQSRPRRGCFDGPPAAPPLAVAAMTLGDSERPAVVEPADAFVAERSPGAGERHDRGLDVAVARAWPWALPRQNSGSPACACLRVKAIKSTDLLDIPRLIGILPDRETCITQTPLAVQRARGSRGHASPRAMSVALSVLVT